MGFFVNILGRDKTCPSHPWLYNFHYFPYTCIGFYLNLENLNTRYIKIVAVNYGNLPTWHPAENKYPSMLFADEIILK